MCKKTIKIIIGLLMDGTIICCLFREVIVFRMAISPLAFPEFNRLFYHISIVAVYVAFAALNRGITPGIKIMTGGRKKESSATPAKKTACATFLDWFAIFSLMLIVNLVLRRFIFVNSLILLTMVAFLYYIISFLTTKQTLGYTFCDIELVTKQGNRSWVTTVLTRELGKFTLGVWLPLGLYYMRFKETLSYSSHLWLFFVFSMVFLLFYYAAKGEAWWDTIGKTEMRLKNSSVKFKKIFRWGCLAFIGSTFLIFLLYNNINNPSSDKLWGFNVPFKKIEYPDNHKVKPYIAFLKECAQDPKEYLLSLFDKYDIVILCEHLHSEDTQWDFIYEVVSDVRFVNNVGHIFTEYGSAREQARVDSFMRTSFTDPVSLAKATATLYRYMGENFHLFMQRLHKLNQTLPDSLRIQEHFTDIFADKYLSNAYYDPMLNEINPMIEKRDSLMAQVVMDWYEQTGGKCLVVTNYRHAFALKDTTADMTLYGNQAQYIYNEFPEVTANVLIHGTNFNSGIYHTPIRNGLWSRAMKNNGNVPVGFDFEGSPFGKDRFDMYPPPPRIRFNYLYQNFFNGYVFYKPEKEYTHSEAYYGRHAAEKEYEWAMRSNLIDTIKGKKLIDLYEDAGGKLANTSISVLHVTLYHFIDLLLWFLWAIIVFFIVVGSLLRMVVKRNVSDS